MDSDILVVSIMTHIGGDGEILIGGIGEIATQALDSIIFLSP
jgi:hypothetical protein